MDQKHINEYTTTDPTNPTMYIELEAEGSPSSNVQLLTNSEFYALRFEGGECEVPPVHEEASLSREKVRSAAKYWNPRLYW